MKCPHCDKKISLFSKALNKFGKVKKCPHCSESLKLFVNFKVAGIIFIPLILLSLFVLKPILITLGFGSGIATGVMGGVIVAVSLRLKKLT
jgi:hypothetical protein